MLIFLAGGGLILLLMAVPAAVRFPVGLVGVIALLLLLLGRYLELLVEKRNFHRTNFAGVQEYSSFGAKYKSGQLETLLRLLSVLLSFPGFFLMVAGIFAGIYLLGHH